MLILAKVTGVERRLLRRLWASGATHADRAHPLPLLAKLEPGWQGRLSALGLLRLTEERSGFVDGAVYRPALRAWRGAVLAAFICVGLVCAAAALFLG